MKAEAVEAVCESVWRKLAGHESALESLKNDIKLQKTKSALN